MKSLWDELDCYVTGIDVLDDGRLIIADRSNRNIKLFDQNRHHMSSYVWPRSIVEERGPDGIASTSNNDIFVIFFKSVKRLQLKNSQLCDRGTFFSNGDWIRCITAQNENVFILTQIQGGKKYVHRLNSEGHSLWVVSVESFANFNVSGHGYHLTSFNYGDKVNILLSGSAKGKLDGKSGTKLEIEQVDFAGPVSYANSLVYFCYYDSNEIFALVPNSNKIKLIIKLPNALYHFPHIGTRSRPQPPIYSINCLVYNPTNEQILVSYGPNNPTTNYLDCIQLKEAI